MFFIQFKGDCYFTRNRCPSTLVAVAEYEIKRVVESVCAVANGADARKRTVNPRLRCTGAYFWREPKERDSTPLEGDHRYSKHLEVRAQNRAFDGHCYGKSPFSGAAGQGGVCELRAPYAVADNEVTAASRTGRRCSQALTLLRPGIVSLLLGELCGYAPSRQDADSGC